MLAIDIKDASALTEVIKSSTEHTLDFIQSSFTPLTKSVFHGYHAKLERLLHAGASVDFQDDNGWTPLMIAAFHGDIHSCHLLLDHGADVNMKNGSTSALIQAACNGKYDVACLLLQHGAQPCDSWLEFGNSAFASAIIWDQCNIVNLFLNYFNERDIQLPLQLLFNLAIERSSEECAILFLEQGIFPGNTSLQTRSVFHMAAEKGQIKLMILMVELNPHFLQEEWLVEKQVPPKLQKENQFTSWLSEYRKQVPSLMKLCKSAILSQLDSYYKPKIAKLPLPNSLRIYMSLLVPSCNHLDSWKQTCGGEDN